MFGRQECVELVGGPHDGRIVTCARGSYRINVASVATERLTFSFSNLPSGSEITLVPVSYVVRKDRRYADYERRA